MFEKSGLTFFWQKRTETTDKIVRFGRPGLSVPVVSSCFASKIKNCIKTNRTKDFLLVSNGLSGVRSTLVCRIKTLF